MKTVLYLFLVFTLALNSAYTKRLQYSNPHNNIFNAIKPQQKTAKPYKADYKSGLPSSSSNEKEAQILRNIVEVNGDGTYHYDFETSNGIKRTEQGAADGTIQGSSSYISPEGIEIKTTYVADETGYHPVGDHIPKIPDYIVRALEYIRNHPYIEKDYYTGEVRRTTTNSKKPLTITTKKTGYNKSNKKSGASQKISSINKHINSKKKW